MSSISDSKIAKSAIEEREGDLVTSEELLVLLGIGRSTLWRLRQGADPIPHEKYGRKVLYPLARIRKWAERRANRTRTSSLGQRA